MTELSTQQAEGLEKVRAWYDDSIFSNEVGSAFSSRVFRWFGYAGTGKTFTAARIPEALGLRRVVFGTYTGKAASVLRRSLTRYGVNFPVTTIHSAIYIPTTSKAARQALDEARDELARLDAIGPAVNGMEVARLVELTARIPELEAAARRLRFEFNPVSEWAHADLIILDEVSMVNAKLAADIESYGVPILVLGDPAQLPPVEGGGYYTTGQPDVLLTEIQRAALDSPVTELATRVRLSKNSGFGMRAADMRPRSVAEAMAADVVLVWTNKRRWAMTNVIRQRLERPANSPVAGDVIMCLTNNKDMAVFNGQLFDVLESRPAANPEMGWELKVRTEDGLERMVSAYAEGFMNQIAQETAKNSGLGMRGGRMLATFGQVITVHKAQGSEWDHVYVVNELSGMVYAASRRQGADRALEQARQWLYTGVTRAKERITVTCP